MTAPALLSRRLDTTRLGPDSVELSVRGAFDLAQSIDFGFGQRPAGAGDVMRLAFAVDSGGQAAAAVSCPAPGVLRVTTQGDADPGVVLAQVARVLSVDVDATGYDELGTRDPLVGRLQAARPGLRPPLFHSAYEALCWSVLSARRPAAQMAQVRDRLARAHGRVFTVDGVELAAFPTPDQLLGVTGFPGVPEVKLDRLHAIAETARTGALDTDALRGLPVDEAAARLRQLPGIGPFYSELVTVRTLGHTDVLPSAETGAAELAGQLLGRPVQVADLSELGADWSPWRTWVCVALRAAGPHALAGRELRAPR